MIGGRMLLRMLTTKQLSGLARGEGDNVEGALGIGHEKLAAHLVGNDTHIETQIDLDAGMYPKLRIEN